MTRNAAVTICAVNYLPKALVLYESYRLHHPEDSFYLVIVDRKDTDLGLVLDPGLSVIWVEDLSIENFLQYAFAFDVIELSTNVKATVLKTLLADHETVVYLDPDIQVFSRLDPVFDALTRSSIVVTPHTNTPVLDGKKPDDIDFLRFGVFNLGFIGVSRCDEAIAFLDWWSVRCLEHGFYEPQAGLAVDQKWVNLAPCYFPGIRVVHDIGLNLAFWNLHERKLSHGANGWLVNDVTPLRFIHFSSFNASDPEAIAHKQNRFEVGSRPDFEMPARMYATRLTEKGSEAFSKKKYGFDYFDDGTYVTPALRRIYSALREEFADVKNPFDSQGRVRKFAKQKGLLDRNNQEWQRKTFRNMGGHKISTFIILKVLRVALFILGPHRYYEFMKYLAYISSLRNQSDMFRRN